MVKVLQEQSHAFQEWIQIFYHKQINIKHYTTITIETRVDDGTIG